MVERRSFLQNILAAATLSAAPTSQAAALPQPFPKQLQDALGKALADPQLAAKLAPVLLDVGFLWEAPSQPASTFHTIIAYSFGNRPPLPGTSTPAPGPVNQALAMAVLEAQRRSRATVIYAQWEIASFLSEQAGVSKVVAINPVIAPDKSVRYLSTDGVAEAAITHAAGDASKLGRVCVIGHHDHAKRCVEVSRARGMDAWAMDGLVLPASYDLESDQPWTRDREIYLIHDMAAQLMQIRAARLALHPQ
ncbi:hypothetical protein [Terriglobus saanensis]|uniref:Putative lipoprotein n=1 Tax=Terriglobus saanensis (strain ATCC BAA-1853 / DSM 23119 / SP1PR4) TaxID=401053 RepID=E8V082_TERSS|nr:hypothetical protein [Terriglobus saanensis]ADV83300.1 putative lipoprotein [Terriglobus saanensis SP1PR4]